MILFNPVVENCDSGQETFLCHNPIYDFKQESFVPSMIGSTSAEGGLYVACKSKHSFQYHMILLYHLKDGFCK